jgi:hypothetical protein
VAAGRPRTLELPHVPVWSPSARPGSR